MDIEKTGRFIREQRDKLGLSQNELSAMVHVTRQAVSNWENGKTLPDSDVLLSLSDLFHVTINDILCGESIEATVLELVDENNKKTNKLKKIVRIFSLVVFSLIVFILSFYFITNYNSIKVYRVASTSSHFRIVDGIIISTSTNTYFKLGKIDIKNKENISVNKVKLYYEKGKQKEIIYENDAEDRLYVDRDGYNEIYRKEFNEYRNDLYLEITYNDTEKEILKLRIKEDFSNGLMMMFDESRALKALPTTEIQERIDFALKEESIQYEKNYPIRNDIHELMIEKTPEEAQPLKTEPFVNHTQDELPNENLVIEESSNNKQEELESDPIEEQEEIEEEQMPEINFDEIISIIETYGKMVGRTKQLEYNDNQKIINISSYRKMIIIDIINGDTLETITIRERDGYNIKYQNDKDGITNEIIDEMMEDFYNNYPDFFRNIYDCLMLVYQETN